MRKLCSKSKLQISTRIELWVHPTLIYDVISVERTKRGDYELRTQATLDVLEKEKWIKSNSADTLNKRSTKNIKFDNFTTLKKEEPG